MNERNSGMDVTIDPRILQQIGAFGRRRRRLILLRGVCALLAAGIVSLSVIALVDRAVFLEDGMRYLLALAAYLSMGAVLWFNCLRWLLRKPDTRELARLFETVEPELREQLLAAVELGDPQAQVIRDSPVFRRLLQEQVASRVAVVPMRNILPWKMIRTWTVAAAVAALAVATLLSIPGLHYAQLLARAGMPLLNLERVSRTQIRVLTPQGGDRVVAHGDSVPVTVETGGAEVDSATLESLPESGGTARILMQSSGAHQFTAAVNVGRESVWYRIRAGDGMSRKYLLHAVPRPQAMRFTKNYRYPVYLLLPTKTVTETNGDLEGIEGTEVELQIEANQPVKSALMELNLGGVKSVQVLKSAGPRLLAGYLPLTVSGTYKISLVGAESGFTNKFSPEYEIRVRADLLPSVTLEKPERDGGVQAEDTVEIRGTARDDLALQRVVLQYRVNNGQWSQETLADAPAKPEVAVARSWDLLPLKLKAGDKVALKLVAMDRKGSRAETLVRTLTIRQPGFDLSRLGPLGAMNRARSAFQQLNQTAAELSDSARRMVQDMQAAGNDATLRRQAVTKLGNEFQEANARAAEAQEQVRAALRNVGRGGEGRDLVLAGRAASRIQNSGFAGAQSRAQAAGEQEEAARAAAQVQESAAHLRQAAESAAQLDRAFTAIVAADEMAIAAGQLEQLTTQTGQFEHLAAAGDPDGRIKKRLAHQREAAFGQIKVVASLLESASAKTNGEIASSTAQVRQKLLGAVPNAQASAWAMAKGSRTAMEQVKPLVAQLVAEAGRQRRELEKQLGTAAADMQHAAKTGTALAAAKDAPAAEQKTARTRARQELETTAAELKDRAALEELRRDADRPFVRDLNQAAQALQAAAPMMQDPQDTATAAPGLDKAAKAFQTLETGHQLKETTARLQELARHEPDAAAGQTAQAPVAAENWRQADAGIQEAADASQSLPVPEQVKQALPAAAKAPEAEAVRKEMAQREAGGKAGDNLQKPLENLASRLNTAQAQMKPAMDAARQAVDQAAPATGSQLASLAKSAGELEKRTADIRAQAPGQTATELQDAVRKQVDAQTEFNQRVDTMRDSLRRDANAQDLATAEGRERARDADDALAMLRQPPPKAEELLRRAAQAPEAAARQESLKQAEAQQDELTGHLQTLARHYQNLENGQGDKSRDELRKAEKELGIHAGIEQAYNRAEKIGNMAEEPAPKLLPKLERELGSDLLMQRELKQLAADAMEKAGHDLKQADTDQNKLADETTHLAAIQQPEARQLAEAAKKLATKAQRLATRDVPELKKAAEKKQLAGTGELDRAAQELQAGAKQVPQDLAASGKSPVQEMNLAAAEFEAAQKSLQTAAQQSAKSARESKNPAANVTAERMQRAGAQATELASQARNLAGQMEHIAAQSRPALDKAAGQQADAGRQMDEARDALARASRHQNRLGNEDTAKALESLGERTEKVATDEMQSAQQALEKAAVVSQAQPAVNRARAATRQNLADFQNIASRQPESGESAPASPTPEAPETPGAEVSKLLAGALDSLDQAQATASASSTGNKKPSQAQATPAQPSTANAPAGKPGENAEQQTQAAKASLNQAVQAQATAMAAARNQEAASSESPTPSAAAASQFAGQAGAQQAASTSRSGVTREANGAAVGPGSHKRATEASGEEWGKLPRRLTRDLMDAKGEEVPAEYRSQVDAYYRVLAERAKEKK